MQSGGRIRGKGQDEGVSSVGGREAPAFDFVFGFDLQATVGGEFEAGDGQVSPQGFVHWQEAIACGKPCLGFEPQF